MKLGELIAVGRECKGWSQRELERRSGISNPLISQIETGKIKDPGFYTVVALLDALGISIDRAATDFRARLDVLRQSKARNIDFDANSEITAGIPSPAGEALPEHGKPWLLAACADAGTCQHTLCICEGDPTHQTSPSPHSTRIGEERDR